MYYGPPDYDKFYSIDLTDYKGEKYIRFCDKCESDYTLFTDAVGIFHCRYCSKEMPRYFYNITEEDLEKHRNETNASS